MVVRNEIAYEVKIGETVQTRTKSVKLILRRIPNQRGIVRPFVATSICPLYRSRFDGLFDRRIGTTRNLAVGSRSLCRLIALVTIFQESSA